MTEQKQDDIVLKDSERQRCEVWTRVMGYHRPVQSFNNANTLSKASAIWISATSSSRGVL